MTGFKRYAAVVAGTILIGLGTVSCVSSGSDTYEDFISAVDSGADCEELFDQRENFDDENDLDRIDRELDAIGCDSPESERTDE